MDEIALIAKYPRLFHLTALGAWEGILRHGLLSTSALLDLFELTGPRRAEVETMRRPDLVLLEHARLGAATVRDQKPLNDRKLAKCLTGGMTPTEWYALLNGRVFFWLDPRRVEVLRDARAYRGLRQTLITLDTKGLIELHRDQILLTGMNTGTTSRMAFPRGRETFHSISGYPFKEKRRVVELTVAYAVPDIERLALRAEAVGGAGHRLCHQNPVED